MKDIMEYFLENNELRVSFNHKGAELTGIKNKKDGREILWSADKSIWGKSSPLLFPIVGKLKKDCYTHQGVQYTMKKHGFAMEADFEVKKITDRTILFVLESSSQTKGIYPFDFRLSAEFELCQKTLTVRHFVENKGANIMCFSIGAHPGFNCRIGDYLEFECPETVSAYQFDRQKIIKRERTPFLNHSNIYKLKEDTFDNDAYILENLKSTYVCIKSPDHNHSVKVTYGKLPFLGIWAKPNAPYVCIEPWFGIDDDEVDYGELKNKRGIQSLEPNDRFYFEYSIEIN